MVRKRPRSHLASDRCATLQATLIAAQTREHGPSTSPPAFASTEATPDERSEAHGPKGRPRAEGAPAERSEAYGPKGRLRGDRADPHGGRRAYFRGSFSGQFAAYHANTAATAPCCFRSSGWT